MVIHRETKDDAIADLVAHGYKFLRKYKTGVDRWISPCKVFVADVYPTNGERCAVFYKDRSGNHTKQL